LKKLTFMNIHQLSTGFVEVPDQISLNIYVQGCEKRCKGCHNPELQSFEGGTKIFLSDINQILKDYPLSKWICWLGGDAVYQPEALIEFNKEFKKRGLEICLYTGKKFEELSDEIIQDLSIVVDGEWQGKPIQDPKTNQRLWVFAPAIEWYTTTWKEFEKVGKFNSKETIKC